MACESEWQGVINSQATVTQTGADVEQKKMEYDAAVQARVDAEAAEDAAQQAHEASVQTHAATVTDMDAAYQTYRTCITGGNAPPPEAMAVTGRRRGRR